MSGLWSYIYSVVSVKTEVSDYDIDALWNS